MSYSSTSAAATSSCVESGFDAQSTTSAAAGLQRPHQVGRVSGGHVEAGRDAVPLERLLLLEPFPDRLQDRHLPVGPLDPPHAFGASERSFTSCRFVVAIDPSGLSRACSRLVVRIRRRQALLFALLPLDPGTAVVTRASQASTAPAQVGLAPKRRANASSASSIPSAAQVAQRPQAIQLEQAVLAVARVRARGTHSPCSRDNGASAPTSRSRRRRRHGQRLPASGPTLSTRV